MSAPAPAPLPTQDQRANAVLRYHYGYRVAQTISGLGRLFRFVGLAAGLFAVIFGIMGSETVMRPNPAMTGVADFQAQHNIYLLSVIFFGAFVAFLGWVAGVVIAGYGQHLKATLDQAVNTSPFLTDSQRAEVMRLV